MLLFCSLSCQIQKCKGDGVPHFDFLTRQTNQEEEGKWKIKGTDEEEGNHELDVHLHMKTSEKTENKETPCDTAGWPSTRSRAGLANKMCAPHAPPRRHAPAFC